MRYRLERSLGKNGAWRALLPCDAPFFPSERGLVGSSPNEQLRFVCRGVDRDEIVEVWQWSDRVPVNPADIQCTDFQSGWKLVERKDSPVPSAEELGVLFMQGMT